MTKSPEISNAEGCNLLCNFAEVVVREIEKEKLRVSEFCPPILLCTSLYSQLVASNPVQTLHCCPVPR